jgi:nitroreductase
MDFQELMRRRYSVRAYSSAPVEEDKLLQILEAARLAPTAANRQPFRVIVIETRGREDELRRIYHKEWFVQAPLVICVCGVAAESWRGEHGKDYLWVDVAIAMDHLILAATDLGLGTCWIGAFNPDEASEILGLPDELEPILFTPLGYPADTPSEKARRPLDELVRYGNWS